MERSSSVDRGTSSMQRYGYCRASSQGGTPSTRASSSCTAAAAHNRRAEALWSQARYPLLVPVAATNERSAARHAVDECPAEGSALPAAYPRHYGEGEGRAHRAAGGARIRAIPSPSHCNLGSGLPVPERGRRRSLVRRVAGASWAAALACLVASGIWLAAAAYTRIHNCGDTCAPYSGLNWQATSPSRAWEWTGQLILACVGAALLAGSSAAWLRGQLRVAQAFLALAGVALVTWMIAVVRPF